MSELRKAIERIDKAWYRNEKAAEFMVPEIGFTADLEPALVALRAALGDRADPECSCEWDDECPVHPISAES